MAIIQSSLILALAGAAAAAATAKYPEVKPGPGLPSLAELGITSAELYQMGKPAFHSNAINGAFSANLDPGCGPSDAYTYDINGVIVCYNYLAKLGDTACVVPAEGYSAFCTSGDAAITGKSQLSGSGTSSACRDVANGVLWVLDHCTRNEEGNVAGFQAAYGNGDLKVSVSNVEFASRT
ncbi:hypothetical protein VHEMI08926 [[Torrubiella] hemipterigena]|uniref:Ecp2 effector protein domain-containing protein n=1 Tax=[Torrubiella] hemipterigena TaxID=1531966 RepID=A0A0A1TPE6_9HYPO|nr:hypothetical protein VHEMI08926 [[Torrubiella] hemipterigena]